MTQLPHRACPVVLAAPSGTGKTTIAHALVDGSERFVFSVSVTTRPPRFGEEGGSDYTFVAEEEFERLVQEDEFAEWASVHGYLYGTPRSNLMDAAERGRHVVLDIDVQGAGQIRESVPEAILIFVFPPSAHALAERLAKRGTERADEVARRMRASRDELAQAAEFDYVVVNDQLQSAVAAVEAIVAAEGHRPRRARLLDAEVETLQKDIDVLLAREFAGAGG